MRKIIILLLCCGVLVSMVGCGGNTAPAPMESLPTMVVKIAITETPAKATQPITVVDPTERKRAYLNQE